MRRSAVAAARRWAVTERARNIHHVAVELPRTGAEFWALMQSDVTVALEVWRRGYACLCPHTNTRHFDGAADDAIWLAGDLAMLARCDVVLMLPGWEASQGATAEHGYAISRGIPVLYDVAELRATDDRGTAGR